MIKKQSIGDILLVLLCGVILCYTAFINNFPLVYSDCGTYIGSGCDLKVPVDRPIFYGLFIRHVSLLASLWLVIWVQGILLALVVFYYFKYLSGTTKYRFYYLFYIILITFFTAASSNVSQLIPDIFTPISILSLGLLLFAGKMKKRDLVITTIILFYSIIVHNSHLFIIILLLSVITVIFIFRRFREELKVFSLKLKRIIYAWIVIIGTFFIACTVNASLGAGFTISRAGHVFMMARLVEMGIINVYLHDNCDKYHYKICEYKDKLPWDFLWDWGSSPLYKFGDGWTSPQVKEEYNTIFKDIFTTPKYCHLFIVKSIESTAKQFFCFGTGEIPVQREGSPSYLAISANYPVCLQEFLNAHQQCNTLNISKVSNVQNSLFGISLFFCIGFLLFPRLAGKYKWIILFILLGLVINAFVCGSFAIVAERFQTRVIWLLPLPLILIMANREIFVSIVQKLFRNHS